MYDLILFNISTKKAYLYPKLEDTGEKLYYEFDSFDIGDVPYGEYEYALIFNELSGVTYEFKNGLLDTLEHYGDTIYHLGDLSPELGLLKYLGEEKSDVSYRDTDKEFYYRRK